MVQGGSAYIIQCQNGEVKIKRVSVLGNILQAVSPYIGIGVRRANSVLISNNQIHAAQGTYGVFAAYADACIVLGNSISGFKGSTNPIYMSNITRSDVKSNIIY